MKYENIISLAIIAGQSIMKIYNTDFDVEYKDDESPLTKADKTANEIIVSTLMKQYPNFGILSEESTDDLSRLENDYCFVVDPLDGTKEFINRNGQFTVNIALTYKKKPIFGVVYVPATEKVYFASRGEGAFLRDCKTNCTEKIHVTNKITDLIWVGSKSHSSSKEEKLINEYKHIISQTISAGSSLKGCMVAEGKADVYYRFGLTCEWDTAAMHCIVEEAGGIFRQMDNSEMLYNRINNLNAKGFFIVNREENIWL